MDLDHRMGDGPNVSGLPTFFPILLSFGSEFPGPVLQGRFVPDPQDRGHPGY